MIGISRNPGSARDARSRRRTIAVLVSTDATTIARYLPTLKRFAGTVRVAGTFAEAQDILATATADVLVTDLRLDGFNGIHLTFWSQARRPLLQSVILGASDPGLECDAQAAGAGFVRTTDLEEMVDALTKALTERSRTVIDLQVLGQFDGNQ